MLCCVRGGLADACCAVSAVLTQLNDGKAVADDLVDEVMKEADGTADGRVSKLELGRAIAVWYAQQLPSGCCLPPHPSLHLAAHQQLLASRQAGASLWHVSKFVIVCKERLRPRAGLTGLCLLGQTRSEP